MYTKAKGICTTKKLSTKPISEFIKVSGYGQIQISIVFLYANIKQMKYVLKN